MDVAKYIITKCTRDEHPISNLQLQKILYILQKEYLQRDQKCLFFDDFEAWAFGPNIPNVYSGKGALLLFGREVSPLAAHILSAGGLAQGVVQGFNVVGPQLLHLHLPDIGDDEVLDERQIGLVGLGCPLVFAALLGQPVHQELSYRHRGRDQKVAGRQLMLDLFLAFHRLLLGGKALPFVTALAVLVLIGVADTVRTAAFRDICHRFASLSSCPVEPRIETVFRYTDASAYPQDTEFSSAVAQVVGRAQADGCTHLY